VGADADALVVGAGPNGLVAANLLADRGWRVTVLEAADHPGGAVHSAEVTEPGFVSDLYSAFYPLGRASPVLRELELERHGLEWTRTPAAVAHPHSDGRCALLHTDIEQTARSLEAFAPGDGERWRELYAEWERVGEHLVEALLTPFPPARAGARILAALNRDLLRFVRFSLLPVRRLAEERFDGEGAAWLLAGNALHADVGPDSAAGGMFGWLLCSLGQQLGFPFPRGGAGRLTDALVRRLEAAGGRIELGARVVAIEVRRGRAMGVTVAGRGHLSAGRAVLADVTAPALYLDLLPRDAVPARLAKDIERFQYDNGTVKVEWALEGPIPWTWEDARLAGTVHVADGMDELTAASSELLRRLVPAAPFLVVGQYSVADPTRAPEGKEAAWGYTHVPQHARGDAGPDGLTGSWDERETGAFVARMEAQMERVAPGFGELVRSRHVATPRTLEAANPNLVRGALNAGTAQLHQQLVFRPAPGLARPETPVRGLYLASASAHPGGGVHGGPGSNAARAALAAERRRRATFAAGGLAAGAAVLGGARRA